MKFLLDVPVGREIAEWLQEQGYDVSEVRTIDPALSDLAILRLARAQSRIVITTDKDFGELAVRQGEAHCGIVRLPDVRATERKAIVVGIAGGTPAFPASRVLGARASRSHGGRNALLGNAASEHARKKPTPLRTKRGGGQS